MVFKVTDVEELYKASNGEVRKEDVAALIEWSKKQPHFPEVEESEAIYFLYSSYNSLEATKLKLDYFYSYMTREPNIFNRDITDKFIKQMDLAIHFSLEQKTPEGYNVMYTRILDNDPELVDPTDQMKLMNWCFAIWLFTYGIAPGHILILDLEGMSLGHMSKMSVHLIRTMVSFIQDCLPVRPTAVHIINISSVAEKLIFLLKQLLRSDLIQLLTVHSGGLDNLYKAVPKNILPKKLGGDGPTLEEMKEQMKKDVISSAEFMKNYEKRKKVDESKRPEKSKQQIDANTGISGSFRTLEVD